MDAGDRHHAILELLERCESARVSEIADMLGVAAVTARNDIRELARRDLIERMHGGARRKAGPGARPMPPERVSRTDTALGMVVPHGSYYFPELVAGARAAADGAGVNLRLEVSGNDAREERVLVDRLVEASISGLVLSTVHDPQTSEATREWLAEVPVPVVLAERRVGRPAALVDAIASDHEQGAYEAVRHLAGLGRRSIGLVHLETVTAPRVRRGFGAAMADLGLEIAAGAPVDVGAEGAADLDMVAAGLARGAADGGLDALVAHHDLLALALVSRLRASGITIPDDLAVVSYDDAVADLCNPPLTAVAPPRRAVGAGALDLLLLRLADPSRPVEQRLLRPELRVRRSSSPST